MNLNKHFLAFAFSIAVVSAAQAQYKEPERKDKVDIYRPEMAFDSLLARKMLARGTATIKGKAFTKTAWVLKQVDAFTPTK